MHHRHALRIVVTHSFFPLVLLRRESGVREDRNEAVVDDERSVWGEVTLDLRGLCWDGEL